jgi:hypothetical protein
VTKNLRKPACLLALPWLCGSKAGGLAPVFARPCKGIQARLLASGWRMGASEGAAISIRSASNGKLSLTGQTPAPPGKAGVPNGYKLLPPMRDGALQRGIFSIIEATSAGWVCADSY